jgi:serine/threonine-protein kinase
MAEPSDQADSKRAPASERAHSLIGRLVAAERYRIDGIIAMGGMGAVYRGEHVHMRKRVAIKILHPETEGLPELVTRFERESIVGAHASHRNVAAATDFGRLKDGTYYLVLEHIDGITLHELMRRGPIALERAVDIARQIALGLDAVHRLNIFHRDLKPRNIMVTSGEPETVKLIDFGFAKVPLERFASSIAEASARTTREKVFGTIGYMAPETAFGMPAVTDRSDLYALGVILYEMLTGAHPFDEEDSKALFRCHMMTAPMPFGKRAPDRELPRAIERVVMRLLEKAPDDRYASPREVCDALDAAMRDPDGVADEPPPSVSTVRGKRELEVAPEDVPGLPSKRGYLGWLAVLMLAAVAGALYAVPEWRERIRELAGRAPEDPAATAAPTASAPPPPTATTSAPPASAAPSASAAPRPSEVEGRDATAWRAALGDAAASRHAERGAKAIQALATINPSLFEDRTVIAQTAAVAVVIELGDRATSDEIFELFASEELGGAGPDILYEIVSSRGGSQGAQRAQKLLARDDVRARSTPALQILLALESTACEGRVALFDRVVAEGDERSLALLSSMAQSSCSPGTGACCLPYEPKLHEALRNLGSRLRTR